MKKISFILALLLVVSSVFCVPAVSLASDGDVVLFSYDGSGNRWKVPAKDVSGTEVSDTKIYVTADAEIATFGAAAPQKSESDTSLRVNFTSAGKLQG